MLFKWRFLNIEYLIGVIQAIIDWEGWITFVNGDCNSLVGEAFDFKLSTRASKSLNEDIFPEISLY